MSDLVNTAIATGGTTFDTATCIGAKCYYPLQQYGLYAKVYEHIMLQTQSEYDAPELNTTLVPYNATTAPLGSKPNRSPFDDDSTAFFVGDTAVTNIGNGLIRFNRLYANIPAEHSEPYGLYARELPSISTENVVLNSSHISNVNLSIEFRYADGVYYQSRESGNQSDFGNTADQYNQSDSYYPNSVSILNTDNDNRSNWREYEAVRAKVVFEYNNSSQDLFTGGKVRIYGSYSYTHSGNVTISRSGNDFMRVCLKGRYSYKSLGTRYQKDKYLNIGSIFTIQDITEDANGVKTVTAYTSPYSLYSWISAYENSYGNTNSSQSFYHYFDYKGYCGIDYEYNTSNSPYNNPDDRTFNIVSISISERRYELSGRASSGEVSASAKIVYRYIKSDDPDSLELRTAYELPTSITDASTPNQQEYRDLVLNNTYKGAENEYIERYMGNIYRLGQIYTKIL